MMKIQLLLAFGLCSSLLSAQSILDIGIFNVPTDSSVLEIRIRPSETVVQGAYTAGVFTVRHLASYGASMTAPSVLNNPLYRYSLVNQGTDGAYKYYSFSFVSPSTVNWTSGQEYPIARVKVSADCQQPNAVFEIINNAWTLANNGNVYQELNGLESQDSIYQPTVTTVLGGTMVDTIPPTLTCTTNKQVSCDTNQCSYTHSGIAWNAIGSDNCSGVTFTYFLSGATLDTLGTLDQALFQTGITDIMVVGADGAGLTDTCMFQVTVADTQSPTLTAPANITVSPNTATCSAGGVQLGNATASDNCPGVQVTSNAPAVFPSGQTVVIWTATDAAGLTTTATQTVLVQSGLSASGLQLSTVSACASDSVSVAFAIQGGTAPYSVTYKVNGANTTLSGYQPNAPVWHTPIVTTVFQLVSITDAIGCQVMPTGLQDTVQIRPAPTFSGLTANPAQVCQGEQVTITATGLLPGQNTTFQYTLQPGGPAVQAGLSGANGSYSFQAPVQPPGFYTLSINAIQVNGCTLAFSSGNSTTFRVQATPSVSGISVADATVCAGTVVEVLAYGLPPDVPATFVYSVNGVAGTATVQTVTTGTAVFISSEFQEGAYTVQLTQVMVAGCTANVLFSAGFAVDPLDEDCGLAIGGRVATEQGAGVEETRVTLSGIGPNGPFGEIDFTDSTGAYRYVLSVPPGSAYTLTPFKNDNPLNGVTTFDLVQISKHILGLERLSSPYKIIAADANRSGSVTTFDIVEFRKLILGIYSVLPNNNSWRFVDKAYVFPDTLNPFSASIPGTIMEDSLTMNALSEDFVGIKVGDVNGTAIPNFSAAAQSRDGMAPPEVMLRVSAPVGHVQPGDRLAVRFEPGEALEGFQFTLENEGLALQEVIADDNLELAVWDGAITASWIGVAQEEEGGVFTLIFQANRPGDLSRMLAFSNRVTVTEAYRRGGQGQPAGLALQWEQQDGPEAQADWLQSSPNPFAEHTRLTYHLPEAGDVVLTVHDELGRMVFRQSGIREAGRHTQVLDRAACPVPGVYVCTLETAAGRRQLKVVKVR